MKKTTVTKQKDIKRQWHLVDLKGQILGRGAVKIAILLMGKDKTYFTRNLDCGDYAVVINAQKIKLSGKKEATKTYGHYSGYPSGLKKTSYKEMLSKQPAKVIRHAVWGMLPKNKLRSLMIKRLFVFPGEEHSYQEKFQNPNTK